MEKIKIIGQIIRIIEQDIVYVQETARTPKIIDPTTPRINGDVEGGATSRRDLMTGRSNQDLLTSNVVDGQYENMNVEEKKLLKKSKMLQNFRKGL